jgi:hypothetical protein
VPISNFRRSSVVAGSLSSTVFSLDKVLTP